MQPRAKIEWDVQSSQIRIQKLTSVVRIYAGFYFMLDLESTFCSPRQHGTTNRSMSNSKSTIIFNVQR